MTVKKGRGTKLTPEVQATAARVLAETGLDKFAYQAIGISRALFYNWKRDNPEFRAAMDKARQDFDEGKLEAASNEILQAKNYLRRCLMGEEFQTIVTEKKRGGEIYEVETKTIQILPPGWYLERLYTGGQEKKELTIRVGVATAPLPSEAALEEDLALHDDEQDQYEHFDSEEVED